MAILFSCPYCTASIKVPDSTEGKLGACPKCGTKIRIPAPAIPPVANTPVTSGPVSPPAQPFLFAPGAPPAVASQPRVESPADPFDFSAVSPTVPVAASSTTPQRPANRVKASSTGLLIGVVIGIVVLAGVGGWQYVKNLPVYTGAVAGARVPASSQAIPVSVPWATIGVDASTQPPVIEYFKRHKSSILSNMLTIEVGASALGLEIRLSPSEIATLVSVDPRLIPDLKELITAQEPSWDATRKAELLQSGKQLCENIAKAQLAGGRMSNIADYRDAVALNALVRGLGHHCQAVTNNTVYPCVFESKDGKLYFVAPIQATELTVQEKVAEGRSGVLPTQFRIQATIPPPVAATPQREATPEAPVEAITPSPESDTEMSKPDDDAEEKPAMEMKSM